MSNDHDDAVRLAEEWLVWSAWAGHITKDTVDAEPSVSEQAQDGIAVADVVSRALLSLSSQLSRYSRIVEAAREWRVGRDRNIVGTAPSGGQRSATGVALIDAVDAFDAAKEQT